MSTSQPARATKPGARHLGYSLSCEEHRPDELVGYARRAEEVGFEYASISDHFHPWLEAQGNSPFVWSVLGAIAGATSQLTVGTGVTCPTVRYHPAIVAQAAATVASLMPGRFFLGVGTGENLNEHIVGARWPGYEERAEMLEEAIGIIRELWSGETIDHRGVYFRAENARLYTLPEAPPPIIVAAAGPKAAELAGRLGDGLINFAPDPEVVKGFEASRERRGGTSGAGPGAGGTSGAGGSPGTDGEAPRYLQVSVCWGEDEAEARRTAHRICGNVALTGELGNQLPSPHHFEQAVGMLREEDVAKAIVCGPDPERHWELIQGGFDAGYTHVHVYQVGPDQEGFFRFYEREILPRLG